MKTKYTIIKLHRRYTENAKIHTRKNYKERQTTHLQKFSSGRKLETLEAARSSFSLELTWQKYIIKSYLNLNSRPMRRPNGTPSVKCKYAKKNGTIDKCYSSHLRRKFLEQESTLTLDGLLKVARAQEAVSRQLKVMEGNASSTGQVNAVGWKNSGGAKKPVSGKEAKKSPSGHRDKNKICFGCGPEGHFQGDKKCLAHDQAYRKCGRTGHFYFRCPQGHPWRGGRFDKNASIRLHQGSCELEPGC